MPQLYRTIVQPVVTEKSSAAFENAKVYTFKVHPKASKPEIREAIEHLFGVTVTDVRTMQMRTKARKAGGMGRGREGRRAHWKKAFVVLKDGDAIPIFEG
jgi:large subunit ribosomal protein L23